MNKKDKVIKLYDFRGPCISRNGYADEILFYEEYKIPEKFSKMPDKYSRNPRFIFEPHVIAPSIKYICPNCAVYINSEWKYIGKVTNRLRKKSPYQCGTPCEIQNYSVRHGYEVNDTHDYSLTDYEDSQKYLSQLQDRISEDVNKMEKEIMTVANTAECPLCSAKLIKKYPYAICRLYDLSHETIDSIDWYKEYKESLPLPEWYKEYKEYKESLPLPIPNDSETDDILKKERESSCLDRYNGYIQACDAESLPRTLKSEKNADFLKEYLMNLINLETNIICMSKRLKELYLIRGENDRDIPYERGILVFGLAKEIKEKNASLIALKQEKQNFEKQPLSYAIVQGAIEPEKPKMLKANIFNKKRVEALNAEAEAHYQSALKKYYSEVERFNRITEGNKAKAEYKKNEEIQKYDEKIDACEKDLSASQQELDCRRANVSNLLTPAVGKKYLIDAEIASLEESLKKSFQCRNDLYSYNVVFEKYRNIVAISTFYEYLTAGRCDSLEGVNGAYNIYENESRMDAIIIKLDEIETKLDEIKANQFMICNKLSSIESSLKSLNGSMEKAVSSLESAGQYLENISNNTDVIAHNTAVSAYYSKVNAELTNALGFMLALN